jgi:CubicO group peptidase (beta-lactamase class C family)
MKPAPGDDPDKILTGRRQSAWRSHTARKETLMAQHNPTRRSVLGLLGAAPLAASAVLTSATAAAEGDHAPTDLLPGGAFDRYLTDLAARDEFSGSVLLQRRGRTVLSRGYGKANKDLSIPNRPDTIFTLGSITKLFTAVAVAQLVQQGKVGYNDKIGAHLDGFPAQIADTVSVHHLLTHTSGLGDFHSPAYFAAADTWTSVEQVFDGTGEFVRQSAPLFTPGADYTYSNSGFYTLGALVAAVSGQSYYDYVREHVFTRAGMTSTGFYTRPQWLADRRIARPYTTLPTGERVDATDRHTFVGLPPGGAFSNGTDLARFANALRGGTLLDAPYTWITTTPKTQPKMARPGPPPPGAPAGPPPPAFGTYAPLAMLVKGQWVLGHNGGSAGVSTNLDWYPATDWVAVILTNYDEAAQDPTRRSRDLITGMAQVS